MLGRRPSFPDTRVTNAWGLLGCGSFNAKARTAPGKARQVVHPMDPMPFRVGLPGRHGCAVWKGNTELTEFSYLSRRLQHPHGVHSYAQTSQGGGTAPSWSHCPYTSHHLKRWGPSHRRTDFPGGLPGLSHSPAAGTPPGQQAGPRGCHILIPRCRCGGSPRGPRTGFSHWPASPLADLQEPRHKSA
jgi:hypothetical protein